MQGRIIIVDYGMGNLHSVNKKISRFNVNAVISSDPHDISSADKIILPGVGHFSNAMKNLKKLNLIDCLNEAILVKEKPILGICLGMQLMAQKSEEGNTEGLGWIEADVVRFNIKNKLKFKVPHIGWNQINKKKSSSLMKGIPEFSKFYFVHSYHLTVKNQSDILNDTEYEYTFTSAVEKKNIYGVQYHPEKSHDTGESLLKNFISL